MTRKLFSLSAFIVLAALVVPAASAEVYTVTLDNGNSFISRYQPVEDPADPSKILLLTEHSNWISLPRAIVATVEADMESRGYGRVIDSRTVDLGFVLNDAPVPGEGEEGESGSLTQTLPQAQERPYSLQQFVEPEEAGGFPLDWTRSTNAPGRGQR